MSGFIEGIDPEQTTLFPERSKDWIGEDHLVRVVDLLSLKTTWPGWAFTEMRPRGLDGRGILRRFRSSSSSMAI